jgi:hypothetical protein
MSSNNLSVKSKSKSRDSPNTDLGKLIHMKNLIENKDYKESKKFLKEITFDHALYLFFKYQISILENKSKTVPRELKIDPNELKEDTDFFIKYDDGFDITNNLKQKFFVLVGNHYFSKKKYGAAIILYQLCLNVNSGNIDALTGIANCYQSLGLNWLSEKHYAKIASFYTWARPDSAEKTDIISESDEQNPINLTKDDFHILPENILLNLGLFFLSNSNKAMATEIFQYLNTEKNNLKTYDSEILVKPIDEQSDIPLKNSDIHKIEFEEWKEYSERNAKNSSMNNNAVYRKEIFEIKKIKKRFVVFFRIPKLLSGNVKITAAFFLYTENKDESHLDQLLNTLGINIEGEKNFLIKEKILENWLKNAKDTSAIFYLKKSKLNSRNAVRQLIKNRLLIKAVNEEWRNSDWKVLPSIVSYDKKKSIWDVDVKLLNILIESLEDYFQLSNQQITRDIWTRNPYFDNLIDEIHRLLTDLDEIYHEKNVPKISQDGLKKLRNRIQTMQN